jgi:hypothetical protein
MNKFAFASAFIFAALAFTAPAHAETVTCTPITALPAVITVQGIYCFTADQAFGMTSGNAIDIQTNNVVLDLNGFKLGGLGAGLGTQATGIHASNRQNITIKNGTIRGFFVGISLENAGASQGHVVEDIRADQNTYVGIAVGGSGNIVRNNQVVATGGSTVFGANAASAAGINVFGNGPRVLNNDVIDTVKQGTGTAWGIFLTSVTGGLAVNNRITTADVGIDFTGSTGKYRDNLTFGVTTTQRFLGGTDAGNNN